MQTPDLPPVDIQAQARFMKLLFFVMVFSVGMYGVAIQFIGPTAEQSPNGVRIGLEACAGAASLAVLVVRFVLIARVLVPDMPIPSAERLAKVRTYFIVCYVFSESVALLGFVLRVLGARLMDAAPLFAGSLILFALCYPRLPEDLDINPR